jgi:hypothetical protein
MDTTTHHPCAASDARFLLELEGFVRTTIDAAPPTRTGLDRQGDGRAPFSLESWRMPGNTGPTPCLVTASFGAVHGGVRDQHVQAHLRAACASRPMHVHMCLSARAWFGPESAHRALQRRQTPVAAACHTENNPA